MTGAPQADGLSPSVEPASGFDGSATSIPSAMRALAEGARKAADYAARYPGHVETNGYTIADLYVAVSRLAKLTAQGIEAATAGETACGLDGNRESAVRQDAPNPTHTTTGG